MDKNKVYAPDLNPKRDRVGGARKHQCMYCKSEVCVPKKVGKDTVYECPKCHRRFTSISVDS